MPVAAISAAAETAQRFLQDPIIAHLVARSGRQLGSDGQIIEARRRPFN
ncbi:hypothetical protein ACIKTA_11980 [Hansschlegelia beijingensis]